MTRWANYQPGRKPGIYGFSRQESKYHNKKVEFEGETFDSIKELRRYQELKLMESSGQIRDLRRQVKYVLIPTQREPDTVGKRGGVKKGKLLEKECAYWADFVYTDTENGELVAEDVKSDITRTTEYRIKRKLMLYVHHIRIKEI